MLTPGTPLTVNGNTARINTYQAAREALEGALQDRRNRQAEVGDARRQVQLLEEELRLKRLAVAADLQLAQTGLARSRQQAAAHQRRVDAARKARDDAQGEQDKAQATYDRALADYNALPATDSKKEDARDKMEAAKERLTIAKGVTLRRQSELDALVPGTTSSQTAVNEAQTRVDTINGQLDETTGPLKAARDALSKAQMEEATSLADLREAFKTTSINTLKDVAAFADLRDNQPVLVSRPSLKRDDTDVVKRVYLFGFPDRRTLTIRGRIDDIRIIQRMVAQFDRPAPQAMMTLWTLELSSRADKDGHSKAQRALGLIEQRVAASRLEITRELQGLYQRIDQEVPSSALAEGSPWRYDPEVWTAYRKEFLRAFSITTPDLREKYAFLMEFLPRPTGLSTPAEAITIIALMESTKAGEVLAPQRSPNKGEAFLPGVQKIGGGETKDATESADPFASLRLLLRVDDSSSLPALSQGLIDVLRLQTLVRVRRHLETLTRDAREAALAYTEAVRLGRLEEARVHQARYETLKLRVAPIMEWMWAAYGKSDSPGLPALPVLPESGANPLTASELMARQVEFVQLRETLESREAQVRAFEVLTPDGLSYPQEAKVNGLLKEALTALNHDMTQTYIEPMFRRVSEDLRKAKGVGVGVVQRTAIIASNRLVARVDPRASAQVPLGQDTNLRDDVIHAFQLATAAQTGGATAFFGGLNRLPKDKPQTIYGLGSGSTFTVTPIVDPTGQSLRFMLDYATQTQVREPNGTSSPQLSTIERHTVNTEVQLSNMELGEISRFEADAKLGIPRQTSGGLPVLRYIPILKEIPLIGWFSMRKGSAATVQRSLIFGHTTMFTTIESVIEVLAPQSGVTSR